jgi:(1->4)-alpha-D-glucan 1-alpha-D-glucosylmutase
VNRWSRSNASFRSGKYPDRNTEYYLYQTLVGAWPISRERLTSHMEKAAREAKQMTSWTQQNREFEDALRNFIERILDCQVFVSELEDFVGRVLDAGRMNSLAQTLMKYTTPGVPDTYQGSELWDLSLADPDNRRPVDYDARREMLRELERGMSVEEIVEKMASGLPKLWLTHRVLCLRRDHPEWFGADAAYTPLVAEGLKSDHLVGYLRADRVAVFVPRWSRKLGGKWAATTVELPQGQWRNVLTGETLSGGRLRAQMLLQRFPVALLTQGAA